MPFSEGVGFMVGKWCFDGCTFRGVVILPKQVRFENGYSKERTLGPTSERTRAGLPRLRVLPEPPQQREVASGGLQAARGQPRCGETLRHVERVGQRLRLARA